MFIWYLKDHWTETFPTISLNNTVNYMWLFGVTMKAYHERVPLYRENGSEKG